MKNLFLALMLVSAISASAQVSKGDKELAMFGNFNAPTEGPGGSGTLGMIASNYLSPHFSLGVSLMMTFYSGQNINTGESELKMTPFLGTFATYNFTTANGKVMPYIGAQFDFSWVETVEPIFNGTDFDFIVLYEGITYMGGKAGLKIFMTEMINFDVNLRYQALLSGPEGFTAGNIGVNFGIGVILPRKK